MLVTTPYTAGSRMIVDAADRYRTERARRTLRHR